MTISSWVLVVFMKSGYAGGVTNIQMQNKEACVAAEKAMQRQGGYFESAYCLDVGTGELIEVRW